MASGICCKISWYLAWLHGVLFNYGKANFRQAKAKPRQSVTWYGSQRVVTIPAFVFFSASRIAESGKYTRKYYKKVRKSDLELRGMVNVLVNYSYLNLNRG